jgi:hypothetical protein
LELENIELFDPVAQEHHRFPPARIITPSNRTKSTNGSRLMKRTKNGSAATKNQCQPQNQRRIERQRKWKAHGFGLSEEYTEQRQIYRKHKR